MKTDTKNFNGKAIYNPSGKAGEYSYWACNFYVGCSNGCIYCYLKKGRGAKFLGGDKPTLKKCFKDEAHALEVFKKELLQNLDELRKYGLFFTFTSDPMLPETINLTGLSISFALKYNIPVKILSKIGDFEMVYFPFIRKFLRETWIDYSQIAFGFTLTGHDEIEANASTNDERIEAMKLLHEAGFKTFASIEPIIDFSSSLEMIEESVAYCNLFKIGLLSGGKYSKGDARKFISKAITTKSNNNAPVFYIKDSLLKLSDIKRTELPENCVTRKYNIFTGGDECLEECTSCNKQFDIEDMESDSGGNWFCPSCWKELEPVMKAEYEELKAKGEIE